MAAQNLDTRPLLIAVLKAPGDLQDALGSRFPAFVAQYQSLMKQVLGKSFDAAAAHQGLQSMVAKFELQGWLATQTVATRGGAVRTRGATRMTGPVGPRPDDLEDLLRQVDAVLGALGDQVSP